MMKIKKRLFIISAIVGAGLLISGIIAELSFGESRYLGFALGFGSAITAVAVCSLIVVKRRPDMLKEEEINEKDERHIQIRGRSAQNTFYISLFGMAAVEIVFLFMDYLIPCFVMIGLMFLHVISYFAFLGHYAKKM